MLLMVAIVGSGLGVPAQAIAGPVLKSDLLQTSRLESGASSADGLLLVGWFTPASGSGSIAGLGDGRLSVAENPLDVLRDQTRPLSDRAQAADEVIGRTQDPDARSSVLELIRRPIVDGQPSAILLGAITRAGVDVSWTLPALDSALDGSTDIEAEMIVRALGSIRTRDAARRLVDVATSDRPEGVRSAATASLSRLSGRTDIGDDPGAWSAWLAETVRLTDVAWNERLAAEHAARAERVEAERRAAVSRLVDALRRVYLGLEQEQRSEFLAGLLRDGLDEVRSLGFDLVFRELSENATLGVEVSEAAIALLEAPRPASRERAARLISQLNPGSARGVISRALRAESEASAASALLQAAARWPDPALLDSALRWTSPGSTALSAALEYVRSLARAGFLQDDADRGRVLTVVRPLVGAEVPPAALDLLISIGTEEDERLVARALTEASASTRQAAASALLQGGGFVDDIILGAERDPELFEIASRAVSMHWATAAGFRAVRDLKAPTPEDWRAGVMRVARMLPAPDLLEIVDLLEPPMREPVLSLLASEDRILSERYSPAAFEALGDGIMRLARLRLEAFRPDAALAALDSFPDVVGLYGESTVNAVRVEALLCLNRLSDAASIPSNPGVWLSALSRCLNRPHGRAIAEEIRVRLRSTLTEAQAQEFSSLVSRLPQPSASGGDPAARERKESRVDERQVPDGEGRGKEGAGDESAPKPPDPR